MKVVYLDIKKDNGYTLRGEILIPEKYESIIVYSNCFTCQMNYTINRRMSEALYEKGFMVVRYDYIGSGISDGDFHNITYNNQVEDLNAVIKYVLDNYKKEVILLGHSLGGITSLICAYENNISKLITLASPYSFRGLKNRLKNGEKINDHLLIDVGGQSIKIRTDYVSGYWDSRYDDILEKYEGESLSFQSKKDSIVPYDDVLKFNNIRKGKGTLVEYDGDHMINGKKNRTFIVDKIYEWNKGAKD